MSSRGTSKLVVGIVSLLAVVMATVLSLAAPAGALDNPDYTVPPPSTVVTTPPPSTPTTAPVQTAVRREVVRTRLAITGSSAGVVAAMGATLVGLGAVVLVLRRRSLADA